MRQRQRRDALDELLADDGNAGLRVVDVMAQLLGAVHRVHRHHHRIGAQHGVVGDDELRAVLQIKQHALALGDAAALLQEAGKRIDIALELGVGDPGAVVVDGDTLRRLRRQVAIDAVARQLERLRYARGPMREVPIKRRHSA